jgi:hypothetical protein
MERKTPQAQHLDMLRKVESRGSLGSRGSSGSPDYVRKGSVPDLAKLGQSSGMLLTKSFGEGSNEQRLTRGENHAGTADEVENVLVRQRVKRQQGFLCCCAPKLEDEDEDIPEAATAKSLEGAKPTRKSHLLDWFADKGASVRQSRASRVSRVSRRVSWNAWGGSSAKGMPVEAVEDVPAVSGQEKV